MSSRNQALRPIALQQWTGPVAPLLKIYLYKKENLNKIEKSVQNTGHFLGGHRNHHDRDYVRR